jgi:Family of unknown function (DUF6142)
MREQNNYQITERRHSRLGIASVIIGIILPILLVLFIVATGFLELDRNRMRNDIEGYLVVVSLSFPVLHLMALIFALIGIFSKKTKKVFPIIGIVINTILMVAGVVLIIFIISVLSVPVR